VPNAAKQPHADIPAAGVAIIPDGRYAYVTCYNATDGAAALIDTTSNTVTKSVPVGRRPADVAITRDGRHTYITNFD
jgi:YVTN family beta-propeller protein